MSVKDILVHVDTTPACHARVWLAARLARRFDAYLLGVGTQEGGAAQERFAAMLTEHEVQGEWRTITGLIEPSIAGLACGVDLIIIGQPDPDRLLVELTTPEDVIIACGRPVLVVPYNGAFDHIGERVLVAWNGSREATQAVHDALPLMAMAQAVTVLRVDPETEEDKEVSAELVHHLVRHGLPATAALTRHNLALFDLVMTRAIDADSDLIVMGAYGHSRWREMILGGMRRDVLNKVSLPVLIDIEVRLPGWDQRPDPDIARDTVAMLKNDLPDVWEKIRVIISNARVTLEGQVAWNYQREAAANAVRWLKGVKRVRNLIRFVPEAEPRDVKREIEAALLRSAEIDSGRVHVEVRDGEVVLTGAVRNWDERQRAEDAAWSAQRVNKVDNQLTIAGGTSSFGTGVALRQWFDGCQDGHVLLRDNSATLHIRKSAQLTPRAAHRLSDDAATEEAP